MMCVCEVPGCGRPARFRDCMGTHWYKSENGKRTLSHTIVLTCKGHHHALSLGGRREHWTVFPLNNQADASMAVEHN